MAMRETEGGSWIRLPSASHFVRVTLTSDSIHEQTNLSVLGLYNDFLAGSIPPELGNLAKLTNLDLHNNQLTGTVPVKLGNLTKLTELFLNDNPLSGSLPLSLTNLTKLTFFHFQNTDLCAPPDPDFQEWLQRVPVVSSTGVTCTATTTDEPRVLPMDFALEANYPNPFNPSTMIRYALSTQARVCLAVYDVRGRLIDVLVDAHQPAGRHAVAFEAGALPSGVYFYRLEAGAFRKVRTMLLLR